MESPPWQGFLDDLRDYPGATFASLMLRPPSIDGHGVVLAVGQVSDAVTASYNSHFFAIDPFVDLPDGQVVTPEELIGHDAWRQSTFFSEFLRPLGVSYMLGVELRTEDGVRCRLQISRQEGERPFSAADKSWVRRLLPHLRRAIRLHGRIGHLEAESQLYAGTVARMSIGMILLDEKGGILQMNPQARAILDQADGLQLNSGVLQAAYPTEDRELHRLVRQVLGGCRKESGPSLVEGLALTRPSGRGKLGVLVRSAPEADWAQAPRRPGGVIFLRDPVMPPQASRDLVMRIFGLTPAEAVLALHLVDSLTLDEAAILMGIRRNTARAHLRAIFSKTGVSRQTALVQVILNSVVTLG
ncbi:MAG: helix-turn-helix transcriptional regulator [Proteobacteria bacterium]|nr:helix-turn-helix transcriptional regulator [Pseudomonadota bacterium]HQR04394.1 helix-turn-helix transcriptional regulator [Rhodocyclaceae bacterium]